MRLMKLEAIYAKPKTSIANPEHEDYPYLLGNVPITHPNHVWSTDITYIPMQRGFMYLAVIMDWYTRYVLAWEISNTLDRRFCRDILHDTLEDAKPHIFNSEQCCQFTSLKFTRILKEAHVQFTMDGRGHALDNIYVERLWRSLKYEDIYIGSNETGMDLYQGLDAYFKHYNTKRPHQALDYRTPNKIYRFSLP